MALLGTVGRRVSEEAASRAAAPLLRHGVGIGAALGLGAAVWSSHPIRAMNDSIMDFALGDPKADEYAVGAPVNLATWMTGLPSLKPRYMDKIAMITGGEGLFDFKHYNAAIIGDTFRKHKDYNASAVYYANKHDQTYNQTFSPMYGPTNFAYQPPVRYGPGAGPSGDIVFGMHNLR